MKDQCYEFIKGANNKVSIVGFGSYGEVKLGRNIETGEMVAIKMIRGKNAKDQIDVHHKLNHPNIIKLLNYYYEKEKDVTHMVLEYAEGGTLNNKIKFGYGQLSKDKVKRYFRDICKAVQYLHSLKYMHRDIKPENILLTKDDHAKLCDFGFAAILEYRSTLCGTYEYMAPEMILEKPYDYKVDIWALGILLFQLIQGTAPFRGQCGQEVYNQMKKKNIVFSNRFQKDEIDLIKKILRVNAENRPTVGEILEHPCLKGSGELTGIQKTSTIFSQTGSISRTGSSLSSLSSYHHEGGNLKQKIEQKNQPKSQSKFESKVEHHRQNTLPENVETVNLKQQQKVKTENKQFKYFVPQGVKASLNPNKNPNNYSTGATTTNYPTYQSFTNNQPQNPNNTNLNTNNSVDLNPSYKQQPQMQMPAFLANQKMPVNQHTKVSYTGQTVPISAPTKTTVLPSNMNYGNVQPIVGQNPGYWRKN